jgi:hypothetical protein
MRIQNTIHTKSTNLARLVAVICLSLLIHPVVMANSADWGLVKRFKAQLEKAENGNVKAMYEVGRLYERGRGTTKNLGTAANWYEKASEAGYDSAKARLGKMYLEGRGVNKDVNKASKLLNTAAQNDVPTAQYQLGVMYEIGIGRNQDMEKALYWYKKAAALGHYQAERKAKQVSATSRSTSKKTKKVAAKTKANPTDTLFTISKGSWQRRKKPSGYLPSSINNCNVVDDATIKCVSSEQERSTGSEIITYSTESSITVSSKNRFVIEYTNNVLEVEIVKNENISGVEDEETATTTTKTSISTGKQDTVHKLKCTLKGKKSISCLKDGLRTLKFTS